jgi:hypothetical protein
MNFKKAKREDIDIIQAGKELTYFLPTGALMSSYAQQRKVLIIMACVMVLSILGNLILGLFYMQREVWVFVKNDLGEVVQVDKESFLKGNNRREDNEIKGFAIRFCHDAFEFTPLDVHDRLNYALRFVEPKAQNFVLDGLRIPERSKMVNQGMSIKIEDNIERGKVPEVSLIRKPGQPIEVDVVFSRLSIHAGGGGVNVLQSISVRLQLREVPRSPFNSNGLIVTSLITTSS